VSKSDITLSNDWTKWGNVTTQKSGAPRRESGGTWALLSRQGIAHPTNLFLVSVLPELDALLG